MIPVFFGWGDKAKDIGYAGVEKCPHCKNYTHVYLKEISKSFSLYFIPVAKWDRKVYLVCPICEACYELDEENKKIYFDIMYKALSDEKTQELWGDAISCFSDFAEKGNRDFSDEKVLLEMLTSTSEKLKYKYGDSEFVRDIIGKAFKFIVDDDKPE